MAYPVPYDLWNPELCKQRGPIPLYGLFQIKNGAYYGYTEHSFHFSWEQGRVRVWDIKDGLHYLKNNPNSFLLRLTRTNSPIICDFKTRQDQHRARTLRKFDGRNVSFVMSPAWKFKPES